MGGGTTTTPTTTVKESETFHDAATVWYYLGNAFAVISGVCFVGGISAPAGAFFAGAAAGAYTDAAGYEAYSDYLKHHGR